MNQELLEKLAKSVIDGDEAAAKKVAQEAIDAKIDPLDAIKNGFAKGMGVVGKKFHDFEIFLPEVVVAAEAMKAGMEVLKPHINAERLKENILGKVVIGTAFGDIHDIGKNLVGMMLGVNGFEVHDMGTDCPSTKFIEKAKEVGADIIAISTLLVTSMYYQKDTIKYLRDMNIRDKYLVMIGGGPVNPEWAAEIGADGYGRFASDAIDVAKILMEKGKDVTRPVVKGV